MNVLRSAPEKVVTVVRWVSCAGMKLVDLLSNVDLLSPLLDLLSPGDVLRAASCSSETRHLLGCEFVWRRLSRLGGQGPAGPEFLMRDYGEYHDRLTRLGLEPLSRSCYQLLCPRHLRWRWRTSARKIVCMELQDSFSRDSLVSYDVSQEFLALGTLLGQIIVWRLQSDSPQLLEGSLQQRIDKITIRHAKIIVLQNGLLSVYSQEKNLFRLKYRKSFENPDPRLLGEAGEGELETGEFRRRYRARDPVTFPGLHVTVSTTGDQVFGSVRLGQEEFNLHHLETGEVTETVRLGLRVEHLAIVHFMDYSHLIYLLLRSSDSSELVGRFYNTETRQTECDLPLGEEFNLQAGFYSLFSEHGLLMMGQAAGSDCQTYQFCCWSYSGQLVYRHSGWAEFGLCLADCGPTSLTTPRSLNLLHNTSTLLTFSDRTHRGAAVLCLPWSPHTSPSSRLWRVSTSLSLSSPRPGCLVSGSEVAGTVCTVSGARSVTVREERTGKVIWEETVDTVIENIWVGDTVIVIIPPDLRQGNTVSCIHIQ